MSRQPVLLVPLLLLCRVDVNTRIGVSAEKTETLQHSCSRLRATAYVATVRCGKYNHIEQRNSR